MLIFPTVSAFADDEWKPKFKNLRFEEDWSGFPEDGVDHFTDPLKHINLSDTVWVSIGGEFRYRYESWHNFGFAAPNDDDFAVYRTFLHTDWHFGEHFRVFLEGKFADLSRRDLPGGTRDALDADRGDYWNAFAEAKFNAGDVDVMFRVGRQELQFGKQRLVSPLDWANNRRIFDAALVRISGVDAPWQLDLFASRPVIVDANSTNRTDNNHFFSGAYFTRKLGKERKYTVDAYVFAFTTDNSALVDEDRYTWGARIEGPLRKNLVFDLEAARQTGDFGALDINDTYMYSANLKYTFADMKWKPWISGGFDYSSGDDNPLDGDINTFNQLFPLAHAFNGFIDVVARQNIVDMNATVGFWPLPGKVRLRADLHVFELANKDDALFNAGRGVVRAGGFGNKDVGEEVDLTLLYKIDARTTIVAGYSHFFAGDFIDASGVDHDIDFYFMQFGYTF